MPEARHRSPGTGRLERGLRRRKKNTTEAGAGRFEKPAPDARAAPPEAHESLISRKTGAEVPLTGLSFPYPSARKPGSRTRGPIASHSRSAPTASLRSLLKRKPWPAVSEKVIRLAGGLGGLRRAHGFRPVGNRISGILTANDSPTLSAGPQLKSPQRFRYRLSDGRSRRLSRRLRRP